MVKMMGQTYSFCLFPILNEVYAGNEDLRREAMLCAIPSSLTATPVCPVCVLGVSYALEKRTGIESRSPSPRR